jgi:hypothetical protein
MAEAGVRIVHSIVEHVVAVLREDLPDEFRATTGIGSYTPGLVGQLPFISVSAEGADARTPGLGGLVSLKREPVDESLIDLGYVTGDAGACLFTLTLWSITRPQLENLRQAVTEIPWVRRARTWEAPPGTLNRTVLLRCRLHKQSSSSPAALPPQPPHITVQSGNATLRAGPGAGSGNLGQARKGDQFELLGKSSDGNWVQGCCFEGQVVWMQINDVEVSVPPAVVPVTEGLPLSPAISQPGTVSQATASPVVVWSQELQYAAYVEATQEPIEDAGERIAELRITRQLEMGGEGLDVERTRLFADREEIVDEFPD